MKNRQIWQPIMRGKYIAVLVLMLLSICIVVFAVVGIIKYMNERNNKGDVSDMKALKKIIRAKKKRVDMANQNKKREPLDRLSELTNDASKVTTVGSIIMNLMGVMGDACAQQGLKMGMNKVRPKKFGFEKDKSLPDDEKIRRCEKFYENAKREIPEFIGGVRNGYLSYVNGSVPIICSRNIDDELKKVFQAKGLVPDVYALKKEIQRLTCLPEINKALKKIIKKQADGLLKVYDEWVSLFKIYDRLLAKDRNDKEKLLSRFKKMDSKVWDGEIPSDFEFYVATVPAGTEEELLKLLYNQ